MKYAIIIIDGAADVKLDELGGLTPLEAANKPFMDGIAAIGTSGLVKTVPDNLSPGSDVAIMSLLGNDPARFYSGRAPIEASARGIALAKDEWAFRCNLVTIVNGVMKDHSSSNISNDEAKALIAFVQEKLGSDIATFYSGVSYRNLMTYRGDWEGKTKPPHDILDQKAESFLPHGKGSEPLVELIRKSQSLLADHPINLKRMKDGKNPATSIWFWGEGKAPRMESFYEKYMMKGAMIAAVDLPCGIGMLMGWDCIAVEGATGYFDTNYAGKGEAAVAALGKYDIVCVHIEAPDEAGHAGEVKEKVLAIERIDRHIVGPVLGMLQNCKDEYKLLVSPDHPTPCTVRTHVNEPVPFEVCGTNVPHNGARKYTEADAASTGLFLARGWEMMDYFLKKA
jgi:2,3-bisphosphoglycerate-independent phosphoglycerate mutase